MSTPIISSTDFIQWHNKLGHHFFLYYIRCFLHCLSLLSFIVNHVTLQNIVDQFILLVIKEAQFLFMLCILMCGGLSQLSLFLDIVTLLHLLMTILVQLGFIS